MKNIIPRVSNTRKCAVCDAEKLRFFKEQEAKGILSSLGLKTPLVRFHYMVIFLFTV